MIYKDYVIDAVERERDRWIARISRLDGKFIQACNVWQNSFYDTTAFTIAAEATKYAKAAIDGRDSELSQAGVLH
jgi:anti-sigma-K factor RskA